MYYRRVKRGLALRGVLHVVALISCVFIGTLSANMQEGWYRPGGHQSNNEEENALYLQKEVILEPTRFIVVPTPQVLDNKQYVVSFHELSYGFDHNIQIMFHPWENQRAGRVLLGVKFRLREDMAFGAGLIHGSNMLGLFFVKSLLAYQRTISYGIIDCQLGSDFTGEIGMGTEFQISNNVKLMSEALVGNSGEARRYDPVDLDLAIGLRYMWPVNLPLKIDFGINLLDVFAHTRDTWGTNTSDELFQKVYIDVSYSSKMRSSR